MTPSGVSTATTITARVLHPGTAAGRLLVLDEPLSFWGGVSAQGIVIDAHHPQRGTSLTGAVVAMTAGRGSSSSSSVLAELIRSGSGPAAVILTEPDVILVLGAAVAAELYAVRLPILQIAPADFAVLTTGGWAEIASQPADVDASGGSDARSSRRPGRDGHRQHEPGWLPDPDDHPSATITVMPA